MLCELCGKDVGFLKPLLIEGSLLKVCPDCAKFGKNVPRETTPAPTGDPGHSKQSTGGFSYTPTPPSKGEVIKHRLELRERRRTTKDIYTLRGEKELVEDYHKRIQQARDKQGWNQEQLGQKINERKSVISKIENKSMKPDDRLVRKLEKALNIKLMEIFEE